MIIRSGYKYKNIINIRMRYLSYVYDDFGDGMELSLNHPEDLISLSTENVRISNIQRCTNLKNLCSYFNYYKKCDIDPLNNLLRVYSYEEQYTGDG